MFHVPEKFRIVTGRAASNATAGQNGAFLIPSVEARRVLFIIASNGMGWDHVSIHASKGNVNHTPYWTEMCQVKDLFWDEEDTVIQYHPKKSNYVNVHPHVLHLWRPQTLDIPLPPIYMV